MSTPGCRRPARGKLGQTVMIRPLNAPAFVIACDAAGSVRQITCAGNGYGRRPSPRVASCHPIFRQVRQCGNAANAAWIQMCKCTLALYANQKHPGQYASWQPQSLLECQHKGLGEPSRTCTNVQRWMKLTANLCALQAVRLWAIKMDAWE
jgi:hypothetical protein